MHLTENRHLAYCTNIHRGNTWAETFDSLSRYSLAVKGNVCPDGQYAIGLRLSNRAAVELSDRTRILEFQKWLEDNDCYVFTINGFPYGSFHGERVKEQVYRPDWTSPDRLSYTNLLFDILSEILPAGTSGSVSTLPGSFKRFITHSSQLNEIHVNLHRCLEHIDELSTAGSVDLHLGVEPEPLGLFETSSETVDFFEGLRDAYPSDDRINQYLGVNYDTCHLAIEYETAAEAVQRFKEAGVRISKIQLSSALKFEPNETSLLALAAFQEETYLHQVVSRSRSDRLKRYEDLNDALAAREAGTDTGFEWRVHFHIPLHSIPKLPFASTSDHMIELLDIARDDPELCDHFEMETYTWEVLPRDLQELDVVTQLTNEYRWVREQLRERGMLPTKGG